MKQLPNQLVKNSLILGAYVLRYESNIPIANNLLRDLDHDLNSGEEKSRYVKFSSFGISTGPRIK